MIAPEAEGHGLDEDTATLLLGLEGVAVAEAALDEAGNPVLALVTAWRDARCCPSCGMRSTRSLGLVITRAAGSAAGRASDRAGVD